MMGVRVIAFIAAIFVGHGWIRVVAIILAVTLPWVAVVVANSGPKRRGAEAPSLYQRRRPKELNR